MDFLGDVGGVADLLMQTSFFIFGGYLTFHSSIETMKALYSNFGHYHNLEDISCNDESSESSVGVVREGGSKEVAIKDLKL